MARHLSILSGLVEPEKIRQFIVRAGIRSALASPHFLVIDGDMPKPDTGVYLYRYRVDGECVGDTWHPTIDQAKEQATFEYGDLLQEWQEIPSDVDMVSYGIERLPRPADITSH